MDAVRPCVIVAGGDVPGKIHVPPGALLICADCGYLRAVKQGLHPDILIGDLDSVTGELPADCEIIRRPAEKDETDTLLAVYCGRERGCGCFYIYGVFGGDRPDHSLANIQMLHHMALQGMEGTMFHGTTRITVQLPGTKRYEKFNGYLSLFSLTDSCEDLTETGVYYPLHDYCLQNSFPLGISNRITGAYAEITFRKGVLLVMETEEPQR